MLVEKQLAVEEARRVVLATRNCRVEIHLQSGTVSERNRIDALLRYAARDMGVKVRMRSTIEPNVLILDQPGRRYDDDDDAE